MDRDEDDRQYSSVAVRLQKWLSVRGFCSRREAERMIAEGRLRVDGCVAQPGQMVRDGMHITLDGKVLEESGGGVESRVVMLHKPRGYLVSRKSQGAKPTIYDLAALQAYQNKVLGGKFLPAVGRLDFASEGLLLLTNKGELALRLTHPRYGCAKVYAVGVSRAMSTRAFKRLKSGITLRDGPVKSGDVEVISPQSLPNVAGDLASLVWYRITVFEGRKHLVRRLFRVSGVHVQRLIRLKVADFSLPHHLSAGKLVEVAEDDEALKSAVKDL